MIIEADAIICQYNEHLANRTFTIPNMQVAIWASLLCQMPSPKKAQDDLHAFKGLTDRSPDPNDFIATIYKGCLGAVLSYRHNCSTRKSAKLLLEVLPIAQQQGFKRTLLNLGPSIGTLFYFLKDHCPKEPEVISQVEQWLAAVEQEPYAKQIDQPMATLSKREREILLLIADGMSNSEIASHLSRSLGTIKLHVHKIYKKLQVKNRMQAIKKFEAFAPH